MPALKTWNASLGQWIDVQTGTGLYHGFGPLANRPDSATVPKGSTYVADEGTTYMVNAGQAWQAIGVTNVGSGAELAYVESSTPFNITAAAGSGSSPGTYVDVTGMSFTVPAGQAFYLETGVLMSYNPNGLTSGKTGVSVRVVDIANTSAALVVAQVESPCVSTMPNVATAFSSYGGRRMTALASPATYKMQAAITGYGQNSTQPAGFSNFYVYGGAGYPPYWLRARAL